MPTKIINIGDTVILKYDNREYKITAIYKRKGNTVYDMKMLEDNKECISRGFDESQFVKLENKNAGT